MLSIVSEYRFEYFAHVWYKVSSETFLPCISSLDSPTKQLHTQTYETRSKCGRDLFKFMRREECSSRTFRKELWEGACYGRTCMKSFFSLRFFEKFSSYHVSKYNVCGVKLWKLNGIFSPTLFRLWDFNLSKKICRDTISEFYEIKEERYKRHR